MKAGTAFALFDADTRSNQRDAFSFPPHDEQFDRALEMLGVEARLTLAAYLQGDCVPRKLAYEGWYRLRRV